MQERALLFMACVESRIEVAFRHLGHVIFVKEFTAIALLAERSEPMLAYDGFLSKIHVSKGTKFFITFA